MKEETIPFNVIVAKISQDKSLNTFSSKVCNCPIEARSDMIKKCSTAFNQLHACQMLTDEFRKN